MAITGIYTKDFPDLGRDAGATDLIPIAEVGNIVTKKTPVSGLITSARVVGALGFTPYGATPGTVGKLAMFGATDLQDSLLSQSGNQINLGTYAAFGVNNPGTPGDPGVDNDAWIGSIINNDFLVKINNVEALRIDTALSLKIANIPKATTDTDKFLVSDGGVVKYRTGAELLSDIGAYNATNPAGYISGITSGMVTTALGFTPYDATNPNGYTSNLGTVTSVSGTGTVSGLTLSGTVTTSGSLTLGGTLSLTSGQITTALGFTPYDATNPAGYITSAALSGYLPLTGGTLESSGSTNTLNINHTSGSGIALNISKNGNGEALTIVKGSGSGNAASITGGITLLSELNLTTKLADAHIASADTWNAKIGGSGTTNYLAKFTASGVVGNSLIFDNGTNVGIGTTSPGQKLTVENAGDTFIQIRNSSAGQNLFLGATSTDARITNDAATPFTFNLNGAERMRITSGGNVLIGTTTDAGYKLDVNGAGRFGGDLTVTGIYRDYQGEALIQTTTGAVTQIGTTAAGTGRSIQLLAGNAVRLSIASNGAATFSSSVTSTGFFVSSDITLKSLTQDKFDASKIDAISYKWKTDLNGKTLVGYSAQDVQKYMPDAVNTDSNGKLSVDYIQVLVQKIAHLENKLKQHGLE
jgi:hypothetical protein